MVGACEMSSDSDSDSSNVSDGTSHLKWKNFEVDHTATSEVRSQILATLHCRTLPLLPSTEFHEKELGRNDAKYAIRRHLQRPGYKKWGFAILRCTYSSEALWTTYLERIRDHVADSLNYEADSDLRDSVEITIIESPMLKDVTWKQARDVFDVWSLEELKKTRPNYSEDWLKNGGDDFHFGIRSSPRTEFFIYADEASVNSVVNSGPTFREINVPGAYYFTVVATGLTTPRVVYRRKDGTPVKDYDKSEGTRSALNQKWKADEYMELYSNCMNDNWPDVHDNDKGGVSRCF